MDIGIQSIILLFLITGLACFLPGLDTSIGLDEALAFDVFVGLALDLK